MEIIFAFISVVLYILAFTMHEEFRILDDRTENNTPEDLKLKSKWHFFKGIVQGLIALTLCKAYTIGTGIFFACAFTVFQDGFLNKEVLHRPFNYVGTTAWLDNKLHKVFGSDKRIFVVKIVAVSLSFVFFIVEYFLL
jgi:hypothetical protein